MGAERCRKAVKTLLGYRPKDDALRIADSEHHEVNLLPENLERLAADVRRWPHVCPKRVAPPFHRKQLQRLGTCKAPDHERRADRQPARVGQPCRRAPYAITRHLRFPTIGI